MYDRSENPIDSPPERGHLTAQSLTLQAPGSPCKIELRAFGNVVGVWLTTGNAQEQIALCTQPGVGPYLEIRGPGDGGLPMALTRDGVQLAGALPSETDGLDRVFVSFRDLVDAVAHVQQARANGDQPRQPGPA